MLASRNHARLVYDGDQSQFTATVPVPSGSAEIEDAFQQAFAAQNLSYDDTEFSGRSDYQAFFKTPEQVALFGGTAGQAFDPNYHTAGDTIANLNVVGCKQMADAAATVTARFAVQADLVTAGPKRGGRSSSRQGGFDRLGSHLQR